MGDLVRAATAVAIALAGSFVTACGDDSATVDAQVIHEDPPMGDAAVDANPNMPATLQETGLCSDPACMTIASDVRPFAPRFELWSDAATKRRWIYLPPGSKIDTTDMDYWVFPVGTKLWKEFSRGGVRVETRLITKVLPDDNAPGAWVMVAYGWNQTQDAATIVDSAGQDDANGTMHDIPSRQECRQCHNGLKPTRVLGFGAMSLDFEAPAGDLDLADLAVGDLLTAPPAGAAPYFPLPGTPVDIAAFGYMHANCGHCHNPTNTNVPVPFNARLRTDTMYRSSVDKVPAHASSVNQTGSGCCAGDMPLATLVVKPGASNDSIVIRRMTTTNAAQHMPLMFIGAEDVDADGVAKLRAWIDAL